MEVKTTTKRRKKCEEWEEEKIKQKSNEVKYPQRTCCQVPLNKYLFMASGKEVAAKFGDNIMELLLVGNARESFFHATVCQQLWLVMKN